MDRHVVLIGYRGSGKTTVGRLLADQLGAPFMDTDEVVAHEADVTIAEIFATEGESGFRKRESAVIERITKRPPSVISLGGGAVVDENNLRPFENRARIVWLKCAANVLHARIAADDASPISRPALTNLPAIDEVRTVLAQREPMYQAWADLVIEADRTDPKQLAIRIAGML